MVSNQLRDKFGNAVRPQVVVQLFFAYMFQHIGLATHRNAFAAKFPQADQADLQAKNPFDVSEFYFVFCLLTTLLFGCCCCTKFNDRFNSVGHMLYLLDRDFPWIPHEAYGRMNFTFTNQTTRIDKSTHMVRWLYHLPNLARDMAASALEFINHKQALACTTVVSTSLEFETDFNPCGIYGLANATVTLTPATAGVLSLFLESVQSVRYYYSNQSGEQDPHSMTLDFAWLLAVQPLTMADVQNLILRQMMREAFADFHPDQTEEILSTIRDFSTLKIKMRGLWAHQ